MSLNNKKNWEEDFSYENGNYQCRCTDCNSVFLGHKRRTICKECFYNEKVDLYFFQANDGLYYIAKNVKNFYNNHIQNDDYHMSFHAITNYYDNCFEFYKTDLIEIEVVELNNLIQHSGKYNLIELKEQFLYGKRTVTETKHGEFWFETIQLYIPHYQNRYLIVAEKFELKKEGCLDRKKEMAEYLIELFPNKLVNIQFL